MGFQCLFLENESQSLFSRFVASIPQLLQRSTRSCAMIAKHALIQAISSRLSWILAMNQFQSRFVFMGMIQT